MAPEAHLSPGGAGNTHDTGDLLQPAHDSLQLLAVGYIHGQRDQSEAVGEPERLLEIEGGAETRREGAKSDTLCTGPVGFAIPEAKMRGAAHGHLGHALLFFHNA